MIPNADILFFVLAAALGGWSGKISKIPGGALLGATCAVAAVGISCDLSHTPPMSLILIVQILTGCMLGQSINRRFWLDFLQIWQPSLVVIGMYTVLAIPFTGILIWIFGFDALTGILAATPARMQDMIVLAGSMHSDAVTVMLMQLVRQFAIIGITPFLLARYLGKTLSAQTSSSKKNPTGFRFPRIDFAMYAILLVPSIIGGFIGDATGHILGALLGAFCGVAASRIIWLRAGEVPFPKSFAFLIQCLAGILLGSRITPETGALILGRLLPLVAACLFVLIAGLIVAWALNRYYKWNRMVSWLAAAPGRASDMLAMSQDLELSNAERLGVVSVHTVRQVYFTLLISVVMMFF